MASPPPEPVDSPDDPAAAALIDAALAPYRALLPAEVLEDFAFILGLVLAHHPVGAALLACLTADMEPGDRAPPDPEGHAVARLLRAQRDAASRASRAPDARFLAPDLSLAALEAYLGTLRVDAPSFSLSADTAPMFAVRFCDSVVACLFFGLVDEIMARPAQGKVGRALSAGLPAIKAALGGAFGKLTRNDGGFLVGYQACGWDRERMVKQANGDLELVQGCCAQAVMALGGALRKGLAGGG